VVGGIVEVIGCLSDFRLETAPEISDFSVVLFRPNFMLVSEEHPVKMHKNQWLLNPLSPLDIPWGVTNQGTPHGA